MSSFSIAHKHDMNHFGASKWPDGLVQWEDAEPPKLTGEIDEQSTGQLRHCAYCGSLHPTDVAAAIKVGAVGEWAERKYGWPHKAYFERIPNPHAGLLESRASMYSGKPLSERDAELYPRRVQHGFNSRTGEPEYHWEENGKPAAALTSGKFYSVHLQDATPEEREIIEKHLRLTFEFFDEGMNVRWKAF